MKLAYLFNQAKTVALGAVATIGLASTAQAEVDLTERYHSADVVALVKITHVRGLVNRAMSMPGMMAVEAYNYHAAVTHNWKGSADNATLAFRVSLSDCSQRLTEEQEYVVLSETNDELQQQSYSCDSLVPKEQAEALMASFDQLNTEQFAQQITR